MYTALSSPQHISVLHCWDGQVLHYNRKWSNPESGMSTSQSVSLILISIHNPYKHSQHKIQYLNIKLQWASKSITCRIPLYHITALVIIICNKSCLSGHFHDKGLRARLPLSLHYSLIHNWLAATSLQRICSQICVCVFLCVFFCLCPHVCHSPTSIWSPS